jgi:sporulation protein YlmC with PRC-barrel domain
MSRFLTVLFAAAAMTLALQPGTAAAEEVIVIDAPDVQKLDGAVGGLRTSDVIGTDVYSNNGERIGEVEDFLLSNGHFYAVVDIQDSPIERYVELGDDDMVVIPWDQLRTIESARLGKR